MHMCVELSQQPIRQDWSNKPLDNLSQLFPYTEKVVSSDLKTGGTKAQVPETSVTVASNDCCQQDEFEFPSDVVDIFRMTAHGFVYDT